MRNALSLEIDILVTKDDSTGLSFQSLYALLHISKKVFLAELMNETFSLTLNLAVNWHVNYL